MNKMRVVAVLLSVVAVILFFNRQKSMVYESPFAETKQAVFAYLDIIENHYSTETCDTILLTTNAPITQLIGFGFHTAVVDTPKKLSIAGRAEYNILAYGSSTIRFKVKPVSKDRTRVTVNYGVQCWTFLPPFVYWELGVTKERRILEDLHRLIKERQRAESPLHTSVGQRPTKPCTEASRLKALHITAYLTMCKAYSLDVVVSPIRRAAGLRPLPYASMCKGFALYSFPFPFVTFVPLCEKKIRNTTHV